MTIRNILEVPHHLLNRLGPIGQNLPFSGPAPSSAAAIVAPITGEEFLVAFPELELVFDLLQKQLAASMLNLQGDYKEFFKKFCESLGVQEDRLVLMPKYFFSSYFKGLSTWMAQESHPEADILSPYAACVASFAEQMQRSESIESDLMKYFKTTTSTLSDASLAELSEKIHARIPESGHFYLPFPDYKEISEMRLPGRVFLRIDPIKGEILVFNPSFNEHGEMYLKNQRGAEAVTKLKMLPAILLTVPDKKLLTSQEFIRVYTELFLLSFEKSQTPCSYLLLKSLASYLQAKVSRCNHFTDESYITASLFASSKKVVHTALKFELERCAVVAGGDKDQGTRVYRMCKFYLEHDALVVFSRSLQSLSLLFELLPQNSDSLFTSFWNQFRAAMNSPSSPAHNILRSAQKLFSHGHISALHNESAARVFDEIQKALARANSLHQEAHQAFFSSHPKFEADPKPVIPAAIVPNKGQLYHSGELWSANMKLGRAPSPISHIPDASFLTRLIGLPAPHDCDSLLSLLQQCISELPLINRYSPEGTSVLFTLCCKLPLPKKGQQDPLWQSIPKERISEVVQSFERLHFELLETHSAVNHADSFGFHQKLPLIHYTFVAVMDLLVRQSDHSNYLEGYELSFSYFMDRFEEPCFVSDDPQAYDLFLKILTYWDDQYYLGKRNAHAPDPIFCLIGDGIDVKEDRQYGYFIKGPRGIKYGEFLKQFLCFDDPDISRKLQSKGIMSDQAEHAQFAGLLNDCFSSTPSIVPKELCALQKIALQAQLSFEKLHFDEVNMRLHAFYDSLRSTVCCKFGYLYFPRVQFYENAGRFISESHTDSSPFRRRNNSAIDPFYLDDSSAFYQNSLQRVFPLSLDLIEELWLIPVDPLDEVNRALVFMSKTFAPLSKFKALREDAASHLFKIGRLQAAIAADPALLGRLEAFFAEKIPLALSLQYEELALWLCALSLSVERLLDVNWPSTIVSLHRITQHTEKDINQASLCINAFALYFSALAKADQEGEDFYFSYLLTRYAGDERYHNVSSDHSDTLSLSQISQIKTALKSCEKKIQRDLINSPSLRSKVLNRLLSFITRENVDKIWDCTPDGRFFSETMSVFCSGDVFVENQRVAMQKRVYESNIPSVLCPLFDGVEQSCISQGPASILFQPSGIFVTKEGGVGGQELRFLVYTNYQGKEFMYVDTLHESEDQQISSPHAQLLTFFKDLLSLKFSGYHLFIYRSADHEECEILLKKTGVDPFLIRCEKNDAGWQLVTEFLENRLSVNSALYQSLSPLIQKGDAISVELQGETDRIAAATIDSVGVRFTIKSVADGVRVFCDDYPQYYLCASTPAPLTASTRKNVVVLQNAAGAKKILFLRDSFLKIKDKRNNNSLMCIDISSSSQLYPKSFEEEIVAVLWYLEAGMIQRAKEALPVLRRSLSKEEIAMMLDVTQSNFFSISSDRRNFSLHLYLLLLTNAQTFGKDFDAKKHSTVFALCVLTYMHHLLISNNIGVGRLSLREEKILLRHMIGALKKHAGSFSSFLSMIPPIHHIDIEDMFGESKKLEMIKSIGLSFFMIERLRNLENAVEPLEAYIHSKALTVPSLAVNDYMEFKDIVRLLQKYRNNPGAIDASSALGIVDIEKTFFTLYQWARGSDAILRSKLKKIIALNEPLSHQKTKVFWRFLKKMLTFSTKTFFPFKPVHTVYPSLEEIENALQSSDRARAEVLKIFTQDTTFNFVMTKGTIVASVAYKCIAATAHHHMQRLRQRFATHQPVRVLTYEMALREGVDAQPLSICFEAPSNQIDQEMDAMITSFINEFFVQQIGDTEPLSADLALGGAVAERINNDLHAYYASDRPKIHYVLKKPLSQVVEKLERIIEALALRTVKEEKDLIAFAMKDGPTQRIREQQGIEITLAHLNALLSFGREDLFTQYTGLHREDVVALCKQLISFHLLTSRYKTLLDALKHMQQLTDTVFDDSAPSSLQQVVHLIAERRSYPISIDTRNLLLFESSKGCLLRAEQSAKIAEIEQAMQKSSAGVLAKMKTGFGKTDVVSRILLKNLAQHSFAQEKQRVLMINIFPQELLENNALAAHLQYRWGYGSSIRVLPCSRDMHFSADDSTSVYEQLLESMHREEPIVMTSQSARALAHQFVLTLLSLKEKPNNTESRGLACVLRNILYLLKHHAKAVIDEADRDLNPRHQLQYPLGVKQMLPQAQIDVIHDAMAFLSSDLLSPLCRIFENNHPYVNQSNHDNQLKEAVLLPLIDHLLLKMNITDQEKREQLRSFVLGVSEEPSWISSSLHKDAFAMIKGLCLFILPGAFAGHVDQHYGLSKQHFSHDFSFAIPYQNGLPKETESFPSQFRNPHEALVKTYFTYLFKGLTPEMAERLLIVYKEQISQQMLMGISCQQTSGYKELVELDADAGMRILQMNAEEIRQKAQLLCDNKKAALLYVSRIVAFQITTYPKALSATGQNFRSMFSSTLGLSATPQDIEAFARGATYLHMPGISGQVLHLWQTKCAQEENIEVIAGRSSQELLEASALLASHLPAVKAFIDVGGFFKGIRNKAIVEKMASILSGSDIKEIVYFDEEKKDFYAYSIALGETCHLFSSKEDPSKRFVIFDEGHTFGSDIKLADSESTVGLLQIGKTTSFTAASQGTGRLRQIHLHQGLRIVVPQDLASLLSPHEQRVSLQDVIALLVENESKERAEYNFSALKQQMDNEIQRAVIDAIILASQDSQMRDGSHVDDMIQMFTELESILIEEAIASPYQMYGGVRIGVEAQLALQNHMQSCIDKALSLPCLSKKQKEGITERLKGYSASFGSVLFPTTVMSSTAQIGTDCEIMQNIQMHQQVEIQVETQKEPLLPRSIAFWPAAPELFTESAPWLKVSAFAAPMFTRIVKAMRLDSLRIYMKKFYDDHTFMQIACKGLLFASKVSGLYYVAKAIYYIAKKLWQILDLAYSMSNVVKKNFSSKVKFFSLKQVMSSSLDKNIGDLFSEDLLISSNFCDVQGELDATESGRRQIPLAIDQKPLKHLCVVYDGNTTKSSIILIDQKEASSLRRILVDAKASEAHLSAISIALYDIDVDAFVAQSSNAIPSDLLLREEFQDRLAQAKLIGGHIASLSDEQTSLLLKRLQSVDPKQAHDLIEKVLRTQSLRQAYEVSSLKRKWEAMIAV